MPALELVNLSKSYWKGNTEHPILENLNTTIELGECIVLLGRSGSGKSTLLNLIAGIDYPDTGEVKVNNINLTQLSEEERTLFRRRYLGIVFQFFNLIPTLTVEENVLLPLALNGQNNLQGQHRAKELLQEVGLADRTHSSPDELSGGEQQRVAIARALVHDPALILADEPTGNLDFETGQQVLALLDRMIKQKGKTLIMVTHSLEMIGQADRVLKLSSTGLIPEKFN
ncbi:ABC transporter ATP-binding protein [Candidatus Nitrosacidococcus sp. I8]|uniref:ABC transporter ATP-binding protein n=1 Tax=Candidatus Nitrosacidococcus sp. I8 TaxID=2942908 RepID=UPI002227CEA8|nr:ABC transporter ATP-binding protein [Candidatus Nitrosacidococcus sp. I8]CAH9018536.1 putative ABC transporter ATP-binding protein [Candidatus Nitrosacidococcus sp. I8]